MAARVGTCNLGKMAVSAGEADATLSPCLTQCSIYRLVRQCCLFSTMITDVVYVNICTFSFLRSQWNVKMWEHAHYGLVFNIR